MSESSSSSCSSISDAVDNYRADNEDERPYSGLTKNRSCTDAYCLFVFLGFLIGWGLIAYYVILNGDVEKILLPTDSNGRICGVEQSVKDKPNLVFFDITKCFTVGIFLFGCPTQQVCVKECPSENWFKDTMEPPNSRYQWIALQNKLLCTSEEEAKKIDSMQKLNDAIDNETCAGSYFASVSVNGICVPSLVTSDNNNDTSCLTNSMGNVCLPNITAISQTLNVSLEWLRTTAEMLQAVEKDLKESCYLIAFLIGASTLSSLFFIVIMGIVARLLIWMTLSIVFGGLCFCTLASYKKYNTPDIRIRLDRQKVTTLGIWFFDEYRKIVESHEFWCGLTIVCGILTVIFIVLVIFLRKRINLAVLIIRESSKAIIDIKSSLIFPIIPALLKLIVIVWFLFIFVNLKTMGNSVYKVAGLQNDTDCACTGIKYKDGDWCSPNAFQNTCRSKTNNQSCTLANCRFVELRSEKLTYGLYVYNFFGLLWCLYFISGLGHIILSYCFSLWYWTPRKKNIPYFTLLSSLYVTFRYHLGTIAVGSFAIATLSFIRYVIEYLHKKLKGKKNPVLECIFSSLRCCFWILQKLLTYVTSNAYTMCAMYGGGYFSSAKSAVNLLLNNIIRIVVIDKVIDFLLLMSKLGLTIGVGALSYYVFTYKSLTYTWIPVAIVVAVTWVVASTFFNVYNVAVDTMTLCFLKDGEINDGSQQKPYYMSPRLKYAMNQSLRYRESSRKKKRVTPS